MDQALTSLVDHVGAFAYVIVMLGVGIESMGVPIPGETVLIAGALLAARGRLDPALLAGCACFGAVSSSSGAYWVGRRWGHRLERVPGVRRIYDERRLAVAQRFFQRWGVLAIFLGRFVALLRIVAGPLAGINGMPWPRFFVANLLGAAVWVGVVVATVLLVGDRAVTLVTRAGYMGLAAVAVLAAAAWWWHRRRVRHEREEGDQLILEQARRAG
ncbi:MAG: DedA family protein, partial [Candidatus Dormibacteria bacterium]